MNALALRAPHILALGAGGCGIELGLKLVMPSARIVGYVEREAFAAANLAAKIEEGVLDEAPIWSDVETFDGSRYRGHVDIVSIGLPCQPFSTAGKRKGIKDERWLWPEVWRIICQVEPRYFFMEEVRGFVQSGFSYTLRDLANSGWSAEWDLFSAAAVGAPHKRERFFLLADSNRKGFDRKRLHISERGSREAISNISGSSESLGYANSAVSGDRQGSSSKGQVVVEGCDELGDPESKRIGTRSMPCANAKKYSRACGGSSKLDDTLRPRRGNAKDKICTGRNTSLPPSPADTKMANSSGTKLAQRQGEREDYAAELQALAGIRGRTFPPGPREWREWRDILTRAPSLEPAVCGVANELAHRLDRLRLCGNGVVPLVAAVAWRVLGERLGEV